MKCFLPHSLVLTAVLFSTAGLQAQKLDESLFDQTDTQEPRTWNWSSGDAGPWTVWIDFDTGTIEQFENNANNNITRAASLGHPEWSNNTLTNAVNRMSSSGFNQDIDYQSRYVPGAIRIGASREVWKGISAGLQLGQAWSPAYVNCTRADGESVVVSWNQVRFADYVDQYLYYDDLYNGNQWQYQNNGVFSEGITGWRVEFVLQQELAHGLGWTASLGTTLGLNSKIESQAAASFGGQGLLDPNELGPTRTPISVASAPKVGSIGMTYRFGPVITGLTWSSVFVGGPSQNEWVAMGADPIDPINQVRLRLGMNF